MPRDPQERTESGQPIYRHQAREREWQPPVADGLHLEAIQDHLAAHVGKVEGVFHELVSDLIHLDVLIVPPSKEHPYNLVCTCGMSDLPMKTPKDAKEFRHAELLIALPEDWPLNDKAFRKESNYWPVGWLKQLARMPHEYETWLGWGHTIPNGDPAEPIENTNFTGFLISAPYWLGPDFATLTVGKTPIHFYNLVPLYQEEMDLKLKKGAEALEDLFEEAMTDYVLNVDRVNVAKRKR